MNVLEQSELLGEIPLFATLTESQLKLLAFTSEVYEYEAGEFLCHQGEASDAIYVVLDGEIEIKEMTGDEPLILATQGQGALIGEMAVLRDAPRSATIQARTKVQALQLSKDRFLELITGNPQLSLYVLNDLATKLANTNMQLARLQSENMNK